MTDEQALLVENVLYTAVSAFHDCDDKKRREKLIKDYTLEFCKENNLETIEVIDKLKEIYQSKRIGNPQSFPYYTNDKLDKIILGNKKNSKKEAPEDIDF